MKKDKVIFWIATVLVFLFEGVMPALTGNTEMAKQGFTYLGFPDFFRIQLTIMKVIGATSLVLPFISIRIREWAYAGLTFTMISAFIAHAAKDGIKGETFFPFIALAILAVSYIYAHKLEKAKT